MENIYDAEGIHLMSPTDIQRMTLPVGHRFVMLIDGLKPWVVPITEPGTYDIDAPVVLRRRVKFPITVVVVPESMASAITRSVATRLSPFTRKDTIQ